MKNILLVSADDDALSYISIVIDQKYNIISTANASESIEKIAELSEELVSVIIYRPSEMSDVDELLDYMNKSNTFIFAVPALTLTDKEHKDADIKYLKNPVIDMFEIGESPEIVRNRMDRASLLLNSTSFSEFAEMLRKLPSLIYLKDSKGKYVFCTQYWHHLEHYDDPDWTIRGKTDMEIRKDTENARKAYESDLKILSTGVGASYIIEENEDNTHEFLQLIKEPLLDEEGNVQGIIALINDVTEQEELKRKLEKLSFTDELTGVYNRTFFDNYIKNIKEDMYPLSIISADCDNLKKINDMYGHMVGDEYIRMSVTMMRPILPEDSIFCRTGGDEFIVFMPGIEADSARRFVHILSEMEEVFTIREFKLSVSYGTSTLNGPDESIEEHIALSDAEMYRNKKNKKAARG
jgi:diguanylate cyclase (GGDEF) domain